MNTSVLNIEMPNTRTPLIGNDVKQVLDLIFQISIFLITSLVGMGVNIVNIMVYKRQGLQDSITLGFFILSISDLIVVFCPLTISAAYLATFAFPSAPYNFFSFPHVSTGRLRQLAYSFSTVLTAFLSIERCCCVITPFKVKSIFTRKRTAIIIALIFLFHVCCYTPLYATHQLRWKEIPQRNNARILTVWYAPNRKDVDRFTFITMSILVPTASQAVVICSSAVMLHGLRENSKFRQTAARTSTSKEDSTASSSGMTSRDAHLVKSMVFLGGILSACQLPYLAFITVMLLEPEVNIGRAYHNIFSFVSSLTFVLASINASANILVYYNNSTRYREICRQLFSCTGGKTAEGEKTEGK